MLDRADYADFGCHNSIRLKAEHFLNTFIFFSGRFVFAVQKHYFFLQAILLHLGDTLYLGVLLFLNTENI